MERLRQNRAEQEDPRQALIPVVEGIYPRWAWCAPEWNPATETEVRRTLEMIRKLALFCQARGVKVVFTGVPHYWQYNSSADGTGGPAWSSRPHDEIARVCAQANVPYLDSFGALAPQIRGTPRSRWYYNDDIHFNPRGYRLWAQAHVAFLAERSKGLLPDAIFRH
jgi:lysophospholipase L1-like esterase